MKKFWFKSLLAGLVLSMGLVSCFDEKGTELDENGQVAGEGNAFASFDLAFGNSSIGGRATTNKGLPAEYKVSTVRIVLYETVSNKAVYVFDLDAKTKNDATRLITGNDVVAATAKDIEFVSTAKEVKKQDYNMVVLVNAPQQLLNVTELGSDLAIVKSTAATIDLSELIGSASDRFFMSNFKGEVFIDKDLLKNTTKAAEANPFPVTVDRGVAKVSVTNDITTVNGATIADFGWKTDIINKKMYWMRKFANIAGGATGGATGGAMETTQVDRYNLYAQDPNFSGVSIKSSTGGSKYPAEFFYHTLATTGTFFSTGDYDYVTENTMTADEQYEDVTTRVIIKLNYIPQGLSAGVGYFVYGTMLVTEQALKDLMNNQANTSQKFLDAVAAAKLAGYINSSNEVVDKNSSFSVSGLKYYAKGICYYAVPIRHFDDTQAPNLMDYGRYGVVRNNLYEVTVKSVTFPGEPDIPDPEGPDDKERVYISADITIQDWFIRGQNVTDL